MNLVGSTWTIWNLIPIDFHSWHHYASLYRSTSWDSGHGISFWQPETKVVTSRKLWNSCHGGRFSVLSFVNTRDARQCLCSFVSVCFCLFHLWFCQMFTLFPTAKQHLDIFCFLLHLCCFRCFCEQLLESYLWVSPRTSCYWRCKPWMQGQDNLTNKKQHKSSRRIQGDKTKRPRTSECLWDEGAKTCKKWNMGSWVQENTLWIWHCSFKQSECSS